MMDIATATNEELDGITLRADAGHDGSILPLCPTMPAAAEYPIGCLGSILAPAAVAIARKVQASPAIAAQSVLAVASLAAQPHADVRLLFGQTRPLSLFLVSVAASGDRKTTVDNEACQPVRRIEAQMRATFDTDWRDFKILQKHWAAESRQIENDKTIESMARRQKLEHLGPEPIPPLAPILTAPDPTVEGLMKIMPLAPASLGIFSGEGGMFVGGYGMSSDHRLRTCSTMSAAWDGAAINRLRAGDSNYLTQLCGRRLALHLMMQPDVSQMLIGDPQVRDQGLLSRILIAAPQSLAGDRMFRRPDPEDDRQIAAYSDCLFSLLDRPWALASGKRNELAPPVLDCETAAARVAQGFYNDVESRCGPGGHFEPVRDFAAKAAEHAARLAGVFSVLAGRTIIDASVMEDACELTRWYLNEAHRLATDASVKPEIRLALKLLDWIKDKAPDKRAMRKSFMMTHGPKKLRSKAALDPVLRVLLDHGHLTMPQDGMYRLR